MVMDEKPQQSRTILSIEYVQLRQLLPFRYNLPAL